MHHFGQLLKLCTVLKLKMQICQKSKNELLYAHIQMSNQAKKTEKLEGKAYPKMAHPHSQSTGVLPHIVQDGDPVLREIAQPIAVADITSTKIQKIIATMLAVLKTQEDGVALAAPQIGLPLQIFVISGEMLATADQRHDPKKDLVFINPKIIRLSKEKTEFDEGCLSVRWLYGKIMRSSKATIRAYNEKGELIERGASGLLAEIFQHETDHLNGVLFTDTAYNIEDIPPKDESDDTASTTKPSSKTAKR